MTNPGDKEAMNKNMDKSTSGTSRTNPIMRRYYKFTNPVKANYANQAERLPLPNHKTLENVTQKSLIPVIMKQPEKTNKESGPGSSVKTETPELLQNATGTTGSFPVEFVIDIKEDDEFVLNPFPVELVIDVEEIDNIPEALNPLPAKENRRVSYDDELTTSTFYLSCNPKRNKKVTRDRPGTFAVKYPKVTTGLSRNIVEPTFMSEDSAAEHEGKIPVALALNSVSLDENFISYDDKLTKSSFFKNSNPKDNKKLTRDRPGTFTVKYPKFVTWCQNIVEPTLMNITMDCGDSAAEGEEYNDKVQEVLNQLSDEEQPQFRSPENDIKSSLTGKAISEINVVSVKIVRAERPITVTIPCSTSTISAVTGSPNVLEPTVMKTIKGQCMDCGNSIVEDEECNAKIKEVMQQISEDQYQFLSRDREIEIRKNTSRQIIDLVKEEYDLKKNCNDIFNKMFKRRMIRRITLHALLYRTVTIHIFNNQFEKACNKRELEISRREFEVRERRDELEKLEDEQKFALKNLQDDKLALWNLEHMIIKYKVLAEEIKKRRDLSGAGAIKNIEDKQ